MPLEVDCSTDLEDGELSYQQKNVQSANFAFLDSTVNHQPSTSGASYHQQTVQSTNLASHDLTANHQPSTSGTSYHQQTVQPTNLASHDSTANHQPSTSGTSYHQQTVQPTNLASHDLTVHHQPSTSGTSKQQQNVPSSLTDLTPSTSGTRETSIPPILPRKISKPTGPGSTLQPTNPSRNTETKPSAKRSLHYLEQLEPNTKKKSLSPAQEVMIELAREEHAWLKREHELRVEILQLEIRTAQYKEEEARRSLNKVNANLNSDP
ncbi:uncharacterized protein LOC121416253 isoform X1 [Lytechinus variegatus]|uniref:uncharacterized protein LOC121416253 isoform X1 n=1 Tax=Lytechinus variegatus TaxID=7654 RepID=UPI001BB16D4A|nr:uncharacterized protein LOC121416253 isoform X1 [Lytechinus variegatus]